MRRSPRSYGKRGAGGDELPRHRARRPAWGARPHGGARLRGVRPSITWPGAGPVSPGSPGGVPAIAPARQRGECACADCPGVPGGRSAPSLSTERQHRRLAPRYTMPGGTEYECRPASGPIGHTQRRPAALAWKRGGRRARREASPRSAGPPRRHGGYPWCPPLGHLQARRVRTRSVTNRYFRPTENDVAEDRYFSRWPPDRQGLS